VILTHVVVLALAIPYVAIPHVTIPSVTIPSVTIPYVVSGFSRTVESRYLVSGLRRTVSAGLQPTRTTNDAVFTPEQAKRGEVLYQFICAACHGAALTGIEAAPPLGGATFTASWTGAALGDLFERIRVSMPQDKPGTLGRQQAADVVAYILSFNKAPAGQTELPGDAEALKSITIVAAQ
jgi:mono/diheme cytochrome c family protein